MNDDVSNRTFNLAVSTTKLSASKITKSILISCGARLAPFDIEEMRNVTAEDELELDGLIPFSVPFKQVMIEYNRQIICEMSILWK